MTSLYVRASLYIPLTLYNWCRSTMTLYVIGYLTIKGSNLQTQITAVPLYFCYLILQLFTKHTPTHPMLTTQSQPLTSTHARTTPPTLDLQIQPYTLNIYNIPKTSLPHYAYYIIKLLLTDRSKELFSFTETPNHITLVSSVVLDVSGMLWVKGCGCVCERLLY